MMKRGVTALVTDGVVRDVEGVLGTNLPVWCDGYAAPPSVAGLTFVGWGEPIGCGGVAVFPNDIVVADQDGCVLIPQAMLDHVLNEGVEQERMDTERRCGCRSEIVTVSLSFGVMRNDKRELRAERNAKLNRFVQPLTNRARRIAISSTRWMASRSSTGRPSTS